MKRFISFSGGVESTTMCILWGGEATPIFCDTGSEHEEMYKRIDFVEQQLKKLHGEDFKIIRIKGNAKYKGNYYTSLTDFCLAKNFLPSPVTRFCTEHFKIKPIDKFLSTQGDCELMIGLNVDEEERRTGNKEMQDNVLYSYPLVNRELTREDCIDILTAHNLNPDFPPYMDRGGCKFCPFKSKKEYAAMVHFAPNEAKEIADLEEAIQDQRGKHYRIRQNMPAFRDFIKIEEANIFGREAIKACYEKPHKHKSCGIFCHR